MTEKKESKKINPPAELVEYIKNLILQKNQSDAIYNAQMDALKERVLRLAEISDPNAGLKINSATSEFWVVYPDEFGVK